MILSAKVVKDPQETKHCEICGWPVYSNMLKLYGMAEIGDKPFNLFFHPDCYRGEQIEENGKVAEALRAAKIATDETDIEQETLVAIENGVLSPDE